MPLLDRYSWADVDELCGRVALSIDTAFDAIVCVFRGGAIPGTILANALGIELVLGMKLAQHGQVSGAGEGPTPYAADVAEVVVPLNAVDLRGLSVLVVDDVSDSGESLSRAVEEVRSTGAATVKSATLHVKTYSRVLPDYYAAEAYEWIFYPWMSEREAEEMETLLAARR